jgi:ABC-type lipoprotein export system ATPase subunit
VAVSKEDLLTWSIKRLILELPLAESFLLEQGIEVDVSDETLLLTKLGEWAKLRNKSIYHTIDNLIARVEELQSLLCTTSDLLSLQVIAGHDKSGRPENVKKLALNRGDLLAIVGPTGSGKSRLLADIEWLATGDTPSKRTIYVDGQLSDQKRVFTGGDRMIAQLSQTMSFVLDATVEELLILHAESRGINRSVIKETLLAANELSGESFTGSTALTNLSGGQTRALMVADTALVCRSPIVLIDEIENAGIDRRKAFDLLLSQEKIVLLATHDPLLALLAPRRLCMSHGAMHSLQIRTSQEEAILSDLEIIDDAFSGIRSQLRKGAQLTPISSEILKKRPL